ncbi:hypothetical protein Y1Q_0000309 [Alligator mississippiensis]|uniref:Uncharacterized protein n=1 Tax=Alligator mississippiensis TaxID=8496 RepID=A0A151P0W5_ALLMI|nr:hypothetical protein Y1Q_0000309 [Alligator mississippiensis]
MKTDGFCFKLIYSDSYTHVSRVPPDSEVLQAGLKDLKISWPPQMLLTWCRVKSTDKEPSTTLQDYPNCPDNFMQLDKA